MDCIRIQVWIENPKFDNSNNIDIPAFPIQTKSETFQILDIIPTNTSITNQCKYHPNQYKPIQTNPCNTNHLVHERIGIQILGLFRIAFGFINDKWRQVSFVSTLDTNQYIPIQINTNQYEHIQTNTCLGKFGSAQVDTDQFGLCYGSFLRSSSNNYGVTASALRQGQQQVPAQHPHHPEQRSPSTACPQQAVLDVCRALGCF